MTNNCPRPNCELQKPRTQYACRKHWFSLPKNIQRDILDGYAVGALSEKWIEADKEALAYWKKWDEEKRNATP